MEQNRAGLDRKIFHLKTLLDTSRELSVLSEPQRIMNAFLLMTMGAVSAVCGSILVLDRSSKKFLAADQGMHDYGGLDYDGADRFIFKCFDAAGDRTLSAMSVSRISDMSPFAGAGFSTEPASAFFFVIDRGHLGVISLGPSISGDPLKADEEELLLTQIANFMIYLKNAIAFETIRNLNEDLERRNAELERTVRELTEAKKTITVLEKAKERIRSLIWTEAERIGRVSLVDLAFIFVVSAVLGLLFNATSPNGVSVLPENQGPTTEFVAPEFAKKRIAGNAIVVDARPQNFYDRMHIENAVNIPPSLFDIMYMMKMSEIDPDREIIVYGRNISKLYDEQVARRLKARDHENVKILRGGLAAWEELGYPTAREK